MATDIERQAKTDEISDTLEALKVLVDEATAMSMKSQITVEGKNVDLTQLDPTNLRTYLDKTFEATPDPEPEV